MKDRFLKAIILTSLLIIPIFIIYGKSGAKVTGPCVNCHTMHNSQDGQPVVRDMGNNPVNTPQEFLLSYVGCVGCHAMGGGATRNIGGSIIPQVYFTPGPSPLAGGNFYYSVANPNRGHNVEDLGPLDPTYSSGHPGAYLPFIEDIQSHSSMFTTTFTCAGSKGCHGIRGSMVIPYQNLRALKGAHHNNVNGQLTNPTDVSNSYRFLYKVKGFENPGWQNSSPASHNEYFGASSPVDYSIDLCDTCHEWNTGVGDNRVFPPQNTISGFCSTCHGSFHTLSYSENVFGSDAGEGIGTGASPFRRHPTDVAIPSGGEYGNISTYSVTSPVARQTVPASPSSSAGPGDVVMCLSCHSAHASPYPSMLRWDYNNMSPGTGCYYCHTEK